MSYFRDIWDAADPDEPPSYFKAAAKQFGIPLPPDVDPSMPPSLFRDAARALGWVDPPDLYQPLPWYGVHLPVSSDWLTPVAQTNVSLSPNEPMLGDPTDEQVAQASPATGGTSQAKQPSEDDVRLLARTIYAEAAGQYKVPGAMEGVGSALRNRIGARGFPKTLSDVVLQPGQDGRPQFRGVNSTLWNEAADPSKMNPVARRAYDRAVEVARGVLDGSISDPTHGAKYFSSGPHKPGGVFIGPFRFREHL